MKTTFLVPFFTGLTLALLQPLLPAQTVGGTEDLKWRFDGTAAGDYLGHSVSGVGDVDGDGFDDLIVGAAYADPNGLADAGSAFVYSGATGAQLWRFDGQAADVRLGWAVAGAGDVDGDGFDDVVVGAIFTSPNGIFNAGSAFVYSGATGAQLFRFDGQDANEWLGYSGGGAGDVDGDGFDDLIFGARYASPNGLNEAGSAFVYSGATGAQIWRFDGQVAGDYLGFNVAGAGDVDGDGSPDLIVQADGADPNGITKACSVFVFSGATGAQIWRFDGQEAFEYLGRSVAGAGDVDGDGFDDLIVGAHDASPNGIFNAGSAFVFSGATGAQVFRFDGQANYEGLGNAVAGAGDVDGDGFDDLLIGDSGASPNGLYRAGSTFVFSGATGTQLWRFDGTAAGDWLGQSVAGAGDVDGDGRPDMTVGAYATDPNGLTDAGSAFVYTFNPILTASAETFSVSAGGTIDYPIDFPDVDGGENYGVLLSKTGTGPTIFKGLLVPLTKDKFFKDSIHGNTPSQGTGFQGTLDPQGQALAHFTAAPGSLPGKLIGHSLFLAAVNKKFDFSSVARRIDFVP